MQNLFLTEDDVFEVKIFVAEDADGVIYCDLNEDGVKSLLGKREVQIENYTTTFKKPSFGDMIELTNLLLSPRGFDTDVTGYEVNPVAARLKTMSCLLKKWDFVDSNGVGIAPTEENIMKLNPTVATAISLQMEDYINSSKTNEVDELVETVEPITKEVDKTDESIETEEQSE